MLRAERRAQQLAAYENQQRMIEKTEEFIEKFRYKPTKSNQVQSRIKQLERIERIEVDEEDAATLNIKFPPAPRSGQIVAEISEAGMSFGEKHVFSGANFVIEKGDRIALVGRNGEGKTTLARMLIGQLTPTEGSVRLGANVNIGYYAQNQDDLMEGEFTVYDTLDRVAVGDIRTRLRDILGAFLFRGEEIDKKVKEAAEILDITQYLGRKPKALSGGQRQRVAIGRAIVRDPQVMLMDEPLSNLDAKLRNQMRAEIIKLRERINTTFIYVTHDQTEAMTLGDRIVIMKDGFIQQVGTPTEVFEHPVNLFVAGFIGAPQMNTFRTELVRENGKYYVTPLGSRIEVDGETGENLAAKAVDDRSVVLGVRPEHITLSQPGPHAIPCTIIVNEMMGSELHIHAETEDGAQLVVRVPTLGLRRQERAELVNGAKIHVSFPGEVMHLFDPETERNLIYG